MFTPDTVFDGPALKQQTITGGERAYSYGRKNGLEEHLEMLRLEFVGQSALEFFHAATTVFIRRKLNPAITVANFKTMWANEGEFLCERLDSRWLVSACDTIIDVFEEPAEVATAISGSLFMNTIKLYETERVAHGHNQDTGAPLYKRERTPLFDGMTGYLPYTGDMIVNLLQRIRESGAGAPVAKRILDELIARSHAHDTVYRRFARLREAGPPAALK